MLHFVFLELVDCKLSLIDGDEVDQFAVLLDIYVGLLNACLQIQDVFLFTFFRFEERLERCLTETEFLKFFLVVTLFALCRELSLHD